MAFPRCLSGDSVLLQALQEADHGEVGQDQPSDEEHGGPRWRELYDPGGDAKQG